MAASTFEAVKELFDTLLRLLHPFMPFLTEELWQGLKARGEKETICTAEYPQKQSWTNDAVQRFENSREAITLIRGQRSQRGMSPKQALEVSYTGVMDFYSELLKKLANLDKLEAAKEAPEGMSSIRVKKTEYYLDMGDHHNPEEEKAKLEKELAYLQGFYKSVNAKLSNERFVSGAPMVVVDREKAKLADAEAKIKAIEEQLGRM
jgi:valyl-tRNA synthetase